MIATINTLPVLVLSKGRVSIERPKLGLKWYWSPGHSTHSSHPTVLQWCSTAVDLPYLQLWFTAHHSFGNQSSDDGKDDSSPYLLVLCLPFVDGTIYGRHYARHFTYFSSSPQIKSIRLLLSTFYRWKNWGDQSLSTLSKITLCRHRIWIQGCPTPKYSFHCAT